MSLEAYHVKVASFGSRDDGMIDYAIVNTNVDFLQVTTLRITESSI